MKFGKRNDPKEVKPPLFAEENEPLSPEMEEERQKSEIKVSSKHLILRIILFIVLLGGGASLVIISIINFISPSAGLQTISCNSTDSIRFSGDYTFSYYVYGNALQINGRVKEISADYSDIALPIFANLEESEVYEGTPSIGMINAAPNQEIVVNRRIYDVLKGGYDENPYDVLQGPLIKIWERLIEFSDISVDQDPAYSVPSKEYIDTYTALLDGNHIQLQFNEANTSVRLVMDEDALFWVEDEEYTGPIIHLGMMKNAYALAYIGNELIGKGYHDGYLLSGDGLAYDLGMENCLTLQIPGLDANDYVGKLEMKDYRLFASSTHFLKRAYRLNEGNLRSLDLNDDGYGADYLAYGGLLGKGNDLISLRKASLRLSRAADATELASIKASLGETPFLYEVKGEEASRTIHISSSLEHSIELYSVTQYSLAKE